MSIPSSPILDLQAASRLTTEETEMEPFRVSRRAFLALEQQAQAAVSPLLAEIERLKGEKEIGSLLVEHGVAALEAEAQKLREALKPFADAAESVPTDPELQDDKVGDSDLTVRDFNRARKALGGS